MADTRAWAALDDWWGAAASTLVCAIDERLPAHWTRIVDGPGRWRWEHRTDNVTYGVAVNARDDTQVLVPYHGWPAKVGPTVMGYRSPRDSLVSVTLPNFTDQTDQLEALGVIARFVPDLDCPERAR